MTRDMRRATWMTGAWVPVALLVMGCGSDNTPWNPDVATVRNPDGTVEEIGWGGGDCLELESGACVDANAECGSKGAADVYLDEKGEVAEVICFPREAPKDIVTLDGAEEGDLVVDNGDLVLLEGGADSPAHTGDLTVSANTSTLWGDDPAEAVIDGNLVIDGNNTLISGITVTGNVIVNFNGARLTNCVIEGNLTLHGNNAKVVGCRVEGNIEVRGNNNELTLNGVDGNIEDEGDNTVCKDNYSGASPDEGQPVACE